MNKAYIPRQEGMNRAEPKARSGEVPYLVDGNGEPIEVMHGSDSVFAEFKEGHFYFTNSPNYSYIKNSQNVVVARLRTSNPYFAEYQSEVERLSVFPEEIARLKALGYDSVIWANPDNPMKSRSGWGDDRPQYVVFDRNQIEIVRINRDIDANKTRQPILCYRGERRARDGASNFGPSGHYAGTYYFSGSEARERAACFGESISSLDVGTAILYKIDSESKAEELKHDARRAGYRTSSASGYQDVEYLKSRGFDGIRRGEEVIIFDVEEIEKRNHRLGRTIDVAGEQKPVLNSEGKHIGESVEEVRGFWLSHGNKCICNGDGKPLLVYRGEHGGHGRGEHQEIKTRLGSVSFGALEAAEIYSASPNNRMLDPVALCPTVISAYLCADKIYHNEPDDPFFDIQKLSDVLTAEETRRLAIELEDDIVNTNNWDELFSDEYRSVRDLLDKEPERIADLYLVAYRIFDSHAVCEKLASRGFNGAIHGGYGASDHAEYKIFGDAYAVCSKSLCPIPIVRDTVDHVPTRIDHGRLCEMDAALIYKDNNSRLKATTAINGPGR